MGNAVIRRYVVVRRLLRWVAPLVVRDTVFTATMDYPAYDNGFYCGS